ncbi:single-stranded DNA-binding protein [Candidatus Peregrinibacteria bacterium]|jgi:single-strand DNA-binding protein|nr:single-stranded DNA-binding protein [Candidatus Peregrinibacteria bacterium]
MNICVNIFNQKKMRSLNKTMLIGHLAADPELKKTSSGIAVAYFPVATNRDWITSDGEKKESVDYHKVIAWRKLADICAQHLVKGSPVYIEGRLQNNSYEDKDGKKHYGTEIVLDELNVLVYKRKKDGIEVNIKNVSEDKNEKEK